MNAQTEVRHAVEKQTKWQAIQRWILAFDGGLHFDPDEYTNNRFMALSKKVEELEGRLLELDSERTSS